MVARRDARQTGRPAGANPLNGLFQAWRRVLTKVAGGPAAAARAARGSRVSSAARLILRYAARPVPVLVAAGPADRDRLKEGGAAALVVGAGLSFAAAIALGSSGLQAFLAVGWLAAWALARLLILRLALSPASPAEKRLIDDAWGPALWPHVLAIVFPLDLFALAASAFLTYRGLTALGFQEKRAGRAVALAFGGQLLAEFAAWLGRAGLLAYVRF